MSTLFAFFHHVLAFTLVSCVAVEFMLIRQMQGDAPALAAARRLPAVDAVLASPPACCSSSASAASSFSRRARRIISTAMPS